MTEKKSKNAYKEAGVDVALGDKCSKMLFEASKATWKNRENRIGEVNMAEQGFGGLRYSDFSKLPEAMVQMNFDGIGTKIEIAERLDKHDTMAFDLLAMVCDDAAIKGLEPLLVGSVLDFHKADENVVKQLAEGLVKAAAVAKVSVMNGEMAELGERIQGYTPHSYNWVAALLALGRMSRLTNSRSALSGQALVGFREFGFRSNGFTLVRTVAMRNFGNRWHEKPWEGKTIGEWTLTPSIIYTPALVGLFGGYANAPGAPFAAAAHITGGGIPGKLGRCLQGSGLGAVIDSPFEPPQIMLDLQKAGNISDRDVYQAWNMGIGMIVVTNEPDKTIQTAKDNDIEAKVIGEVIEKPEIRIKNMGINKKSEQELTF